MKRPHDAPPVPDFCRGDLTDGEYRVLAELYRLQSHHNITRISFHRLQILTRKYKPERLEFILSVLRDDYHLIRWRRFDDTLIFAVDESELDPPSPSPD